MNVLLALLAYVAATCAAFGNIYQPDPMGLVLLLLALALALAGCCRAADGPGDHPAGPGPSPPRHLLALGLVALTVAELEWLCLAPPVFFRPLGSLADILSGPAANVPPRWLLGLGLALVVVGIVGYFGQRLRWRRYLFLAILGGYGIAAGWVIAASPAPGIDVWHFQQGASELILQGMNPYTGEYFDPHAHLRVETVPGTARDGKLLVFPYPPWSFLVTIPGYGLGDVRWSHLAAVLGTTGLIVAAGRRLGLPAGHPTELAAVTLLLYPRGLMILEAAFTEPFAGLALAGTIWAMAGTRPVATPLVLGAGLASKQYMLICLPALWSSGRLTWRQMLAAILLAGAVSLPFFVWDPAAFWRSVVLFNVGNPFEQDSLSVPAAIFQLTGYRLPALVGFGACLIVVGVVVRFGHASLASAVLGTGATYLAFFVFSRAGNPNYYWLVGVLLAMGVVLAVAEASSPSPPPPAQRSGRGNPPVHEML
jgi:hypothetical protein